MVGKEIIRDRLVTSRTWITTSRTALSAAVAERQIRYIVKIRIHGDGVSSRTASIEKLEDDGTTYTMKFDSIPVPPADVAEIPEGSYDIEDPVLVCEGGTRPFGQAHGAAGISLAVTTEYWDNDI